MKCPQNKRKEEAMEKNVDGVLKKKTIIMIIIKKNGGIEH